MNTSQLIHISSEIVVLLGFTFYLQRQITKLSNVYAELKQKVEANEELASKRFDMISEMIDSLANQIQYNKFSQHMTTSHPSFFPQQAQYSQQPHQSPQHQSPPIQQQDSTVLRNRKTKQNNVNQPMNNEGANLNINASEPMRLNNNTNEVRRQVPNANSAQMMGGVNLPFNPLDILSNLSNMAAPVFSATIVTENIIPQKKDSDVKIVEIEENLDDEIKEELEELLSENNNDTIEEEDKRDVKTN